MNGDISMNLWATIDDEGNLLIEGQDLGPVDEDGDMNEYEWVTMVAAELLPRVLELLGGAPGDDLLDLIERDWVPKEGAGLERMIRDSGIPYDLETWRR
jgi:hypothetical protein